MVLWCPVNEANSAFRARPSDVKRLSQEVKNCCPVSDFCVEFKADCRGFNEWRFAQLAMCPEMPHHSTIDYLTASPKRERRMLVRYILFIKSYSSATHTSRRYGGMLAVSMFYSSVSIEYSPFYHWFGLTS